MSFRRVIQALSFIFFITLLLYAAFPLKLPVPVDLFLRMDPLVSLSAMIASRDFISTLLPGIVLLILTIFAGRFFCSMVCPLGTCIDMTDNAIRGCGSRGAKNAHMPSGYRILKYMVLAFVLAGALVKVSMAAYAAPIPIVTRFFAMLIYPVLTLLVDAGLSVFRPIAQVAGITSLAYADLVNPVFGLKWLILAIPAGIFALSVWTPRFWCRHLCPAGAVLALLSWRPGLFRRRVTDACTSCGLCIKACPMDAINEDPHSTDFSECIACRGCSDVCPEGAVHFASPGGALPQRAIRFSTHRRALMAAALAGLISALMVRTGLKGSACEGGPGRVMDPELLRPPGSLPECSFLERCVGCGECMKTCPTNTLQPAVLSAGLAGIFTPVLVPRRGPCDTACNACGHVCPTGAIRPLSPAEKRYAKIGTAAIMRQRCIAWEHGKACLICDEVCPYGAISLQRAEGLTVAVPYVDENRCNGCGFCEYYCPVQARSAIVVEPMDALRLQEGSYREKSRQLGLSIETKQQGANGREGHPEMQEGDLPPGFTE